MTGELLVLPALLLAALGAIIDVRTRRLPNWLCAVLAVVAGITAFLMFGGMGLVWALAHAAIALIFGAGLFAARMIGAGDAKFYAASALAIPLEHGLLMLAGASLAGLAVLVAMALRRMVRRRPLGPDAPGMTVPFGLPIAAGFALTLGQLSTNFPAAA